jgi:hypothetical protein
MMHHVIKYMIDVGKITSNLGFGNTPMEDGKLPRGELVLTINEKNVRNKQLIRSPAEEIFHTLTYQGASLPTIAFRKVAKKQKGNAITFQAEPDSEDDDEDDEEGADDEPAEAEEMEQEEEEEGDEEEEDFGEEDELPTEQDYEDAANDALEEIIEELEPGQQPAKWMQPEGRGSPKRAMEHEQEDNGSKRPAVQAGHAMDGADD